MTPRFSVLMPAHNRADVIGYAIRSVLWQTEQDFELLIVGDGCTDNTAEVVAGFGDPRIRWFDLPKAPYFGYANRNIALRRATGEYVAFAAHDDLLFPDHLALLAATLEGAEWAYSRPLWANSDGTVIPLAINLTNADELERFLAERNHIPASCVMYPRDALEKYGYWPEDVPIAADWRHWIRVIEGGGRAKLAYCRLATALHFRAIWKSDLALGMPEVAAGLEIAKRSAWWPAELRLAVPQGLPEQAVFFEALASADYVARLRNAVDRVLERLAWDRLSQAPGGAGAASVETG
jgi:glycosyltransferase involved in cell wall biosynthesis